MAAKAVVGKKISGSYERVGSTPTAGTTLNRKTMLDCSLYVLVPWPESQSFMDVEGAFLVMDTDIAGDSAYMVPHSEYHKRKEAMLVNYEGVSFD